MTDGGLTLEEAIRLQGDFKPKPGPVDDYETLATLITVAMVCNVEELANRPMTFEAMVIEVRELLAEGQTVSEAAIRTALDRGVPSVVAVPGGWQWQ